MTLVLEHVRLFGQRASLCGELGESLAVEPLTSRLELKLDVRIGTLMLEVHTYHIRSDSGNYEDSVYLAL
jgi:hypothetical protein